MFRGAATIVVDATLQQQTKPLFSDHGIIHTLSLFINKQSWYLCPVSSDTNRKNLREKKC
ncbi:hypothetical protein E2C01_035153 [Portunus trituberculatus]|uniref:Uncharacterized protein n=1 Tax=Portunus trituberculatus TaxID=210409 RepID=A0A5B7FAP3_PORTR|nr:hypothetical protein [Portunus trituberculatus]